MSEGLENQELEQDTSSMYLEQIKNLKANSVSKEAYDKLMNENRNLLQTIVEGKQMSSDVTEQPKKSLEELTKELKSGELNNLDYIKTSLEHRQRCIEERGFDPYVGISHTSAPSDEAIRNGEQVAEFLEQLVKTADGNSQIFTNEYQRLVGDSLPNMRH